MKKSLLSVALCVMTLLIGISPVSAQGQNKEYQETLHKMLLLSGGLATVDTMVPQIIGMMKQQVPAMPDSVSRQIEDLMAEYFPKMLEMMTPIYAKYYTEEDLDGLIAFYESPLGKKMASTQPLILKEVMGVVPQWAAEFGSKMSEIVKSAKIQTQP